jgi:hypothetical protein
MARRLTGRSFFRRFQSENNHSLSKPVVGGKIVKYKQLPLQFVKYPLSPLGRKQVGSGKAIQEFVGAHIAKGLFGLVLIKALTDEVASFKQVSLPAAKAQEKWAMRTADEIISSRSIVVQQGEPFICGCTDLAQAIVAAARVAGFPSVIVREHLHTSAKIAVEEKGGWVIYIVDASLEAKDRVRAMTEKDKKDIDRSKRRKYYAEGRSLDEIGIKNYNDFRKYQLRRRQRNE